MDDCQMYFYLLSKVDRGKDGLLDWLEFLDFHIENEPIYEIIIGWSQEKTKAFVDWFDFDLDRIDIQVYEWDEEYIIDVSENENNPAFAEQSYSLKD